MLLKWFALLSLVAIGLAYLNGAAFSAWMSGGPPNPYPVGWGRRSLGQLSFALAAFVGAFGVFRAIGKAPSISRSGVLLLVVAALLVLAPYLARFVIGNACVDQGGGWSNLTLECKK